MPPIERRARVAGEGGAETETLGEAAYQQLRRDIVAGVFEAGKPLRLEALRQRYEFSFSPLREALTRLQSEQLVASTALRGFSVAPLSREEMSDAAETRILIECEALRRSMRQGGGRLGGNHRRRLPRALSADRTSFAQTDGAAEAAEVLGDGEETS